MSKYIDAGRLKELLDAKYKEFTEKAKKDCPLQYQYMADGLEIAKQFVDSLQQESSEQLNTLAPDDTATNEEIKKMLQDRRYEILKAVKNEYNRELNQAWDDAYHEGYIEGWAECETAYKSSLQQEPIEKDVETEKLIVCDIIEATIARINGGKKDEEKEENIMRGKIAYLRDLGLKNNDN